MLFPKKFTAGDALIFAGMAVNVVVIVLILIYFVF